MRVLHPCFWKGGITKNFLGSKWFKLARTLTVQCFRLYCCIYRWCPGLTYFLLPSGFWFLLWMRKKHCPWYIFFPLIRFQSSHLDIQIRKGGRWWLQSFICIQRRFRQLSIQIRSSADKFLKLEVIQTQLTKQSGRHCGLENKCGWGFKVWH